MAGARSVRERWPLAPRRLVVVVGEDGAPRRDLTHELIEAGHAVVLCAGPSGGSCALVREGRCAVVDVADAAVFMPSDFLSAGALRRCIRAARHAVLVPCARHAAPADAGEEPAAVARRVGAALRWS